jgi:hypothetical protein
MRFEVKVSLFISPQFLSSLVQAIKMLAIVGCLI